MTDRRSLIEGLKQTPAALDAQREKEFVFQSKASASDDGSASASAIPSPVVPLQKSPISTRIRADFATALKRASLERQLSGTEPNTLQDILEAAIEPWLRSQGYLS